MQLECYPVKLVWDRIVAIYGNEVRNGLSDNHTYLHFNVSRLRPITIDISSDPLPC